MNHVKRVFAVALCLVLLVACLPWSALAQELDTEADFEIIFSELVFIATVTDISVSNVSYTVGETPALPVITATYNNGTSETLPADIRVAYPEWPTEPGTYNMTLVVATKFEVPFVVNVLPVAADIVYGDATGDDAVDGNDVLRLKRYLANLDYETGASTIEVAPGADATGDGVVDGNDVLRLKRYLANMDYETGNSTVVLGPQ